MKSHKIPYLSLLTAALFLSGCASTRNYKKAENTSNSLETAAVVINQCNAQVGVVTQTLGKLVESPSANRQPQFEKFDSELTKLKSLAKDMNDQSTAIQTEGTEYFKSWDEDLAKIKNEDIRSRSTERKHIMAARFEKVRINYEQAKGEVATFLSNLTDIRTALASDLTAGGLDSIEDATEDSEYKAKQLKKILSRLQEDFKDLSASMSTTSAKKVAWL